MTRRERVQWLTVRGRLVWLARVLGRDVGNTQDPGRGELWVRLWIREGCMLNGSGIMRSSSKASVLESIWYKHHFIRDGLCLISAATYCGVCGSRVWPSGRNLAKAALAFAFPMFSTDSISDEVQSSRTNDLTFEICTPKPRCTPVQLVLWWMWQLLAHSGWISYSYRLFNIRTLKIGH